jgi:arylsulfatase A-like enzyme
MHHSIVDWIPPASAYGLPLNETTIAEKMQEAGYETHASGKAS